MANARQVARWIVDDIIGRMRDHMDFERVWDGLRPSTRIAIASDWVDTTEAYVKKYSADDDPVVHHIDGNPLNNDTSNLRIADAKERDR